MNDWDTIFSSALNSRIYTVRSEVEEKSIKASASRNHLSFAGIDLYGLTDRYQLFKEIAAKLSFPSYFGMNWDALLDCLTDMQVNTTVGYVILIKNFYDFRKRLPRESKMLEQILFSAVEYWKSRGKPFYIIIS